MKTTLSGKVLSPERVTELYTALLLLLLPLLVHDAYFDITRTKTRLYLWLTAAYLLTLTLLLVLTREKPHVPVRLWVFCAFLAPFVLSSALYGGSGAWLGADNRYQGILSALLYAFAALGVCAFGRVTRRSISALLMGFALCSALAVAYILGWDVFGFVGRLKYQNRYQFISTLGNVDFMAAYCTLLLPVAAALALSEKERSRRAISLAVSVLGVWAALATGCDSAVLGILAALSLMPLLLRDAAALRRFPLVLPVLSASVGAYALCSGRMSELVRAFAHPVPLTVSGAAGIVLWLFLRRRDEEQIRTMRKRYSYVFLGLLVLFLLALALVNTVLSDRLSGIAAEYLRIDNDWGSGRGKIWRGFAELYRSFSPIKKLIGGGAGCVAAWDREHRLFADAVTDAAHNEYLHYLLTNGALGLAAYLLFLLLSLQASAKRGGAAAALGCGCAAYAVQAAVNIAQPFTTPLFFTLLFLSGTEEREEEDGKRESRLPSVLLFLLAAAVLWYGAVNGAPRPVPPHDPDTEMHSMGEGAEILYTAHDTPLYLSIGGKQITTVPPHTPLTVTGAEGDWLTVQYKGKTLWCQNP